MEHQQRERLEDPHALLTLPEFVRESVLYPEHVHSHSRSGSSSANGLSRQGSGRGAALERTSSLVDGEGGGSGTEGKSLKKKASITGRLRSRSVSGASAAGAWLTGKSWSRQSVSAIPPSPGSASGFSQGLTAFPRQSREFLADMFFLASGSKYLLRSRASRDPQRCCAVVQGVPL